MAFAARRASNQIQAAKEDHQQAKQLQAASDRAQGVAVVAAVTGHTGLAVAAQVRSNNLEDAADAKNKQAAAHVIKAAHIVDRNFK